MDGSKQANLGLAVLISGTGRTLQTLIERIREGSVPATIKVVVSSKPGAGGLDHARTAGIPAVTVDRSTFPDNPPFSGAIAEAIDPYKIDLAIMAGFLNLWRFPSRYEGKVLNIHPALLPDFGGKGFYGRKVHEAVLASGATESGCTVHFADHEYDRGPVILQKRVPVRPDDTPDTLAARVFEQECLAYPEAIRLIAEGRVAVR